MPSNRKTRDRQLAKLAERRRRERVKRHRQRILAAAVGITVAVGGLGAAVYALTRGSGTTPAANRPSASPPAVACGGSVPEGASTPKPTYKKAPPNTIVQSKTYTATLETSCGTIVIELDQKLAPKTVNSVVFLAKKHFYDGLTFHRIAKDFVIQGGDPKGDGTGGPGYQTVDAPPKDAKYAPGVVAMAKGQNDPAGASGSQFFIVTGTSTSLPPDYAIIGQVIEGQDVAEQIEALPIQKDSPSPTDGPPASAVYIVTVTIKVS